MTRSMPGFIGCVPGNAFAGRMFAKRSKRLRIVPDGFSSDRNGSG